MASKWSMVSGLSVNDSNRTLGESAKLINNGGNVKLVNNIGNLQTAIARFNTLAQAAYDRAVLTQQQSISKTIASKFAKATLKEVVSNAIGTFGVGAVQGGVFSDISMGGGTEKLSEAWSSENFIGKGVDYTFGANGGWMAAGDSGMSRLAENSINAGVGLVLGQIQATLEDATYDQFGKNDSERVADYISRNTTTSSNYIFGTTMAIKDSLPDLHSDNTTVKDEKGAHQAKERDGTGELIKEAVHQIDQLCYALNELDAMEKARTTWSESKLTFRKCREMVEFMGKMYWFRRKYNKTRHFMHKLKEDYVAVGMVMQQMNTFWRDNIRAMELLAMRAAAHDTTIQGKFGAGKRVHLVVEEFGIKGKEAQYSQVATEKGKRNWRKV